MSRVSVAITTYNRLEYLKECIASIRNQTFQDFDIYIFDDASTEPVEEMIKNLKDQRITFFPAEHNLGAAKNIQRVFNYEFKSPYIIAFHDDDVMHPSLIQRELDLMEKNQDLIWVGSNLKFCNNSQMNIFDVSAGDPTKKEVFSNPAEIARAFLGGIDLGFGSVMYRTQFLKSSFLDFDQFSANDDRPYLVNLARQGQCAFIKNKLMNYRMHENQDSKINPAVKTETSIALMKFYKDQLPHPLKIADKMVFYNSATNNLLDAYLRFDESKPSPKKYIKQCRSQGVLNLWYLNRIGLRAIFRQFLLFAKLKNKKN